MVVGVGTVGSQIARELAQVGVRHLWLVDGDHLEEHNLIRHALTREYLGENKANAMADFLMKQVPGVQVRAESRDLDDSASDGAIDRVLNSGDLVIAATDDRQAQRRIAGRAIALDIPAILPALYGDSGGEVFVQRSARHPCFYCWDGYRPVDERMRGVAAINADTLAVLQLAVHLSIGVLDPASPDARFMVRENDPRPLQVFIQRPLAALEMSPQSWLSDCPQCPLGPAEPRPNSPQPASPDLEELRHRVRSTAYSALGTAAGIVVISTVVIVAHVRRPTAAYVLALTWIVGSWVLYVYATDCKDAWDAFVRARNLRDHELRQQR